MKIRQLLGALGIAATMAVAAVPMEAAQAQGMDSRMMHRHHRMMMRHDRMMMRHDGMMMRHHGMMRRHGMMGHRMMHRRMGDM